MVKNSDFKSSRNLQLLSFIIVQNATYPFLIGSMSMLRASNAIWVFGPITFVTITATFTAGAAWSNLEIIQFKI
jgi:hypothetical protein